MTQETKSEPICGAKGEYMRAMCELSPGHVQSINDWHECSADIVDEVGTNTYHTTRTTHEVTRWRPNPFEIENREARKAAVDSLVGSSTIRKKLGEDAE